MQLHCVVWALLWGSVDRSNSSASSQHSCVSAFSWSFASQILALDSWPLNVGEEKLAPLFPHGFAVQGAVVLSSGAQGSCNLSQVCAGPLSFPCYMSHNYFWQASSAHTAVSLGVRSKVWEYRFSPVINSFRQIIEFCLVWFPFFLPANNTAISSGWTGKAPGWSHSGCEGAVVPDEEMLGKNGTLKCNEASRLLGIKQ